MSGQQGKDDELTFVVTTNPFARSSAANKRRVRSVAALRSWPERRKKTFENVDQSGSLGGFVLDAPEPSTAATPKKAKRKRTTTTTSNVSKEVTDQHQSDEDQLFERCTRSVNECCDCIHCRSERTYLFQRAVAKASALAEAGPDSPPPTESRKRTADGDFKKTALVRSGDPAMLTPPASPTALTIAPSKGKAEPFNCYPVPYQPWFDRILHHMMTIFAPRAWPALKITDSEGLHWEWFMTQHALSEPALFYVRLLFASGDLINLKVLSPELSWWLQAQAVNAINDALSDPERATSDPLILAVGRIAMHEAFYGNKEAANGYHRPAQRRMIQMRGGMKALPFPGLVKRLMRWGDNVMAMRSGTERMLEDEEENNNFSVKQQVDFLEKLVPTEGRELRKKIKISDLLSPDST